MPMPKMQHLRTGACLALGLLSSFRAAATTPEAPPSNERADRFDLSVHSEMYGQLFRRALLPGPNGTLVQTDTVAPLDEYLLLRAHDLDVLRCSDCIDVELAAWEKVWIGDRQNERVLTGDVQTAYLRYRQ